MILIFSKAFDESTSEVCGWLKRNNKKFLRINDTDKVNVEISTPKVMLSTKNNFINITDVESTWFKWDSLVVDVGLDKSKGDSLANLFLSQEETVIKNYLFYLLEQKKCLGTPYSTINKLIALNIASGVGFKTPSSYCFVQNRIELPSASRYIHKPLSNEIFKTTKSEIIYSMSNEYIQDPGNLGLTSVQQLIEKNEEIRVLYLVSKCYAVSSKTEDSNSVNIKDIKHKDRDYREYFLSEELKTKIIKLMKALRLNFGSIDLLKKDGIYYFLEVNPHGQFGFFLNILSCNLSKEIAEVL